MVHRSKLSVQTQRHQPELPIQLKGTVAPSAKQIASPPTRNIPVDLDPAFIKPRDREQYPFVSLQGIGVSSQRGFVVICVGDDPITLAPGGLLFLNWLTPFMS